MLSHLKLEVETFKLETIFPTLEPKELLEKLKVYCSLFDQAWILNFNSSW